MAINDGKKSKRDIVKKLLNSELTDQDDEELLDLLIDQPISIDIDKQEDSMMSLGDKVADKLSEVAGSWGFIIGFIIFLLLWICLNYFGIIKLDDFPFILLRNQNDYRTDLKSELITEVMHDHITEILRNQRKILRLLEEDEDEKNSKK